MHSLLRHLFSILLHLGGFGLVILGVLDSSFLIMPLGNDLLLIALSARHHELVPYYAAMATAGSVTGCFIMDVISRRGGEKGLERTIGPGRTEFVKKKVRKRAGWALALASLMPPPFPFTPFVAGAAALQYPRKKLLGVVAASRFLRFCVDGLLAVWFGTRILRWVREPEFVYVMLALIVISLVASAVSVNGWIRHSERPVGRIAPASPYATLEKPLPPADKINLRSRHIIIAVMKTRRPALSLLLALHLSPLLAEEVPLRWVELPNLQMEVDGLPWYGENGGELFRLPVKLKDTYRKPVWELAQSPSGGRIRFRTNATTLVIRLEYPEPPGMKNMHAFGQTGVDLYADGVYRGTAIADRDAKPGKTQEHTYFKNQPRIDREITLYLPLYMPVKVLGIGFDADARVQGPRPFALKGPVVFYGTSITQGGCASRPGMSYQAILGRMLNVDFVNLGFSGNGLGEPELARAVAGIDASCFVVDFAQNNPTVESLAQAYAPFLETIRGRHPATPILVITPIYASRESWARDPRLEGMRELIRTVAARRIAAGDLHLEIVEGTDLLGPSGDGGLVDGTHPNDLGFEWMANGLAGRIARVLGLRPER